MTPPELTSRNWLGKATAGTILGYVLALGLSGLLYQAIGAGDGGLSTRAQFTMWAIAPLWCTTLSACFLFRTGLRAWTMLGTASALVWVLLFALGALS